MRTHYERQWNRGLYVVIGARTCGVGNTLRRAQHDARTRTSEAKGKERARARRRNRF